jgi:DNA-binding LacI/PurR family transcriptional regulator
MENSAHLQRVNSQTKAKLTTSQRRPTIGLLLDWLTVGFQAGLWHSVAEYCQQLDVNLICFIGKEIGRPDGSDFPCNILYDLAGADNVDGLIVSATIWAQGTLEKMTAFCQRYQPLPLVTIAASSPGIPAILTDNYQCMPRVLTHLLDVHG